MQKEQVFESCKKYEASFRENAKDETFQLRGIFDSEALLLSAISKALGVSRFVESGRARGHSTNLLAKNFIDTGIKIVSIDVDKYSSDARYSHEILSKFKNVELIYGDTNNLLPDLLTEPAVVFIDGPKGDEAIKLAIAALENKNVKAVALHDVHKNTFHRTICEQVFTNTFFSDDKDFVNTFKYLDDGCWEVLEGTGEAPYQRYNKSIASYASTLGVFFNTEQPFNELQKENYLSYLNIHEPSLQSLIAKHFPYAGKLRRLLRIFG